MADKSDAQLAYAYNSDVYQHIVLSILEISVKQNTDKLLVCNPIEVEEVRAVIHEVQAIMNLFKNANKRTLENDKDK